MEKAKLDRINELARKSREVALSPEELAEQATLRGEYLAEIRASFGGMLDNTVIKRPDGSIEPLKKRRTDKH